MRLTITNDGQRITATNYWKTPSGRSGAMFLSLHARAFRLLVPASAVAELENALWTTRHAVVSQGPWGRSNALEVLLEDGTQDPWRRYLQGTQCDPPVPTEEHGREDLRLLAYGPGVELLGEAPARYRLVRALPCQDAWVSLVRE
jgi:hypothetical protein